MEDELHIGRGGIDIKGRDAITIGLLALCLSALLFMAWKHLEADAVERKEFTSSINSRMETIQTEHTALADSVKDVAPIMKEVVLQLKLNNYLLVATDKQTEDARKRLMENGVPELLRRKE